MLLARLCTGRRSAVFAVVMVMVAVFMLIIGSVDVCVIAFVAPARLAKESVFRE